MSLTGPYHFFIDPQPPNFSRIRREKKTLAENPPEKNAASRKSAEKVCQPAKYKKKIKFGWGLFLYPHYTGDVLPK